MSETIRDPKVRRAALTRLALATRERLPDSAEDRQAFFHVYLDGELNRFTTDTFVQACRRLETQSGWFPKKAELLDACRTVAKQRIEAARPRLALPPGDTPLSSERLADLKARFKAIARQKAMR